MGAAVTPPSGRRGRRPARLWVLAGAAVAVLVGGAVAFPLLLGLSPWLFVGLAAAAGVATAGMYRLLRARLVASAVLGVLIVAVAIQAVPYGWSRSNPPVGAEPAWDSPRTRELAERACFDCHSNEVAYPWYAYVAPASWAVQRHVSAGRAQVNFSEWDRPQEEADESAETVREGSMPPRYFTLLAHREARLSDAERQELIDGLVATIGDSERGERDSGRDDD